MTGCPESDIYRARAVWQRNVLPAKLRTLTLPIPVSWVLSSLLFHFILKAVLCRERGFSTFTDGELEVQRGRGIKKIIQLGWGRSGARASSSHSKSSILAMASNRGDLSGHAFHRRGSVQAGGCLTGKQAQVRYCLWGGREHEGAGGPYQVRLNPARQSATMIFFIVWG